MMNSNDEKEILNLFIDKVASIILESVIKKEKSNDDNEQEVA